MLNVKSCKWLATVLLATILTLGSSSAGAIVLLDQIYEDTRTGSGGSSQTDGNFRRAQTFTVGLDGVLVYVDMMGRPGTTMRILTTIEGVPTSTELASTSTFTTLQDGWIRWDFSTSGLVVTQGEVLAMEMISGDWDGHHTGGYAGGADYFLNLWAGVRDFTRTSFDWFFRTFVDSIDVDVAIQSLLDLLEALVADGTLTPGQANGLRRPLLNAQRSLDNGQTAPACSQVQDFIDEVNQKVADGALPQEQADVMIDLAIAMQVDLQCF